MHKSDRELIAGLKAGEMQNHAFQMLVEKYQERLYWHIRRIVLDHDDADDVLQNTFVKVWKNLNNFREESGLYTWLYRIATNESLTFINSKKRKNMFPMSELSDYLVDNLEADPYFDGDEIQEKLQKAIITLPEKQRLVFNMKYFDNLKYKEMSKILDTSVGALKASYHHAVRKIEEFLSKIED
ncbi:MAG: sigma-70 family RNA polymerase sigma factor [Chlorobi bacterium]|nr:sigma-70 family RNA polymerase sigma factor [Chlorobiota bacterium]